MERVNAIYSHVLFIKAMQGINIKEIDRKFCRHGIAHLLDVARICAILAMDEGEDIPRDVIYAAALMHDIGRYFGDSSHAEKSKDMCAEILPDCGYTEQEIAQISNAVLNHGDNNGQGGKLGSILHRADKISRLCSECGAADLCKWEKLNEGITL